MTTPSATLTAADIRFATLTAADTRFALLTSTDVASGGPVMPALTPWYAALGNRQTTPANIICLGDSITEGQGATVSLDTGFENRWLARLRDMLRSRFPTPGMTNPTGGGRGYINVAGTGEGSFTWPTTINGSPPAISTGPKASGLQLNTTGQSVVYSLNGDSCDIMWQQVAFGGTFSYQVDGNAAVNVSTNGGSTLDGKITHVSLGAAGAHTLTLAWVSGNANVDGVAEYNGDFSAGIHVHDAGHFGWQTSSWLSPLTAAGGPSFAIAALSPAVVVITLGVNDQFSNVAPATYQANLQSIISDIKVRLTAPFPSFVLLMMPPRQGQGTYTYAWSQYISAANAVAAADSSGIAGASVVSVCDASQRMPGADADVYGFWHAGDLVHPSNKGHDYIADFLTTFLSPV